MIIKTLKNKIDKSGVEILPSDSIYFKNIKCTNCGHVERVPFNVADYRCEQCK